MRSVRLERWKFSSRTFLDVTGGDNMEITSFLLSTSILFTRVDLVITRVVMYSSSAV